MGHAIYFFLYLLDFVIIQVFFIFKCLSVPSSRKKCLAITIIYTVVFYAADYITYGPDPGHMTMEMYIINSVFHAINTFIYFAIILIFAEGYMPRNVIKLFFYYDVLSLATSKFTFGFLPTLFISDDMNVSPSVYAAHTIDDMWLIIPYYLFICIFIIAYLLFNNLLTQLLEKIPDSVCLVIFVTCIISFLITRIVSAFLYEDLYGNNAYKSGSFFFGCMILITFLVIMLFFILSNAKRKQEYQEIRTLEKNLQYNYYCNVFQINTSIHKLRHDLANHIATIRYMPHSKDKNNSKGNDDDKMQYVDALHNICSNIEEQIAQQTSWQVFDTNLISNREKYDVFQYIQFISSKYKINYSDVLINTESTQKQTKITAIFPSKLNTWVMQRSIPFKLIETIATTHHGIATWKKGGDTCIFCIHLH